MRDELKAIQSELKKPFPASYHQIRELPGKGFWAFLPHQIIRQRLDEIAPEWQSDFSAMEVVGVDVVCRCGITILGIRKEAIGSVPLVAATNKEGKDVSRGSAADRVAAEAFKNAAEMWGVGAYLDDQGYVATYLSNNAAEMNDEVKNKLRSLITYLRNKGELPPPNSTVTKPAPRTEAPTIKNKPLIQPSRSDRELLMLEVESLCKRKGITPEKGKEILLELYGVKGRSQLRDDQLLNFRDYLSMRPEA
ncbi:Rad52/Rad22 family DNA repair protein [Aulosira sp. FACHB-615]|uniref:Rad52/Rad22 family DNA repair protein n=1 Tax=Aulosira sp. FACHB-615 TaxID=2692777 RepID=UPI001689AE9A|nr:Rad52/Rad22 family DNA repair protein [Aulosira sp. FACHB-615]MBD2492604.1 hypothetical protein [Aulosira sp. FACHB-615]